MKQLKQIVQFEKARYVRSSIHHHTIVVILILLISPDLYCLASGGLLNATTRASLSSSMVAQGQARLWLLRPLAMKWAKLSRW